MTESTSIDISVKYLDALLLKYYKDYFKDENIKLSRKVYSDTYHDDVITTVITRKVKIGNHNGEKKYVLTNDEIKNVLNEDLEKEGYSINHFRYVVYNDRVANIEADLKERQKQKVLR